MGKELKSNVWVEGRHKRLLIIELHSGGRGGKINHNARGGGVKLFLNGIAVILSYIFMI